MLIQESMASLGLHHPLSTKNLNSEAENYNPLSTHQRGNAN
jgi:hypothetical protein